MTETTLPLTARPALPGLVSARSATTAGVRVERRDRVSLATVISRKAAAVSLAARVREVLDITLPQGPRRATLGEISFIGVGPGTWLATYEGDASDFVPRLAQALAPFASVSDQSDAYPILRLAGHKARETLARLVPVDVDARAFQINDAATTVAAHITVTLWRVEDQPEGSPAFELAFPRSVAECFWHALHASGAEFGLGESALGLGIPVAPAD